MYLLRLFPVKERGIVRPGIFVVLQPRVRAVGLHRGLRQFFIVLLYVIYLHKRRRKQNYPYNYLQPSARAEHGADFVHVIAQRAHHGVCRRAYVPLPRRMIIAMNMAMIG